MTSLRQRLTGSDQRACGLTAAERARTIIASTTGLRVGILNLTTPVDRHAVTADGTVLFVPGADSPERIFAIGRNLPPQTVHASATDLAPVPHADRVRGSLVLSGSLAIFEGPLPAGARSHLAGPTGGDTGPVLALRPTRITLTWHCEDAGREPRPVDIGAADYRSAQPDPLLPHETEWLAHLHRDHADVVRALAATASSGLDDESVVHPLCLDRYGIVLRVLGPAGHRDVRLDFERPAACGCELHAAVTEMMARRLPAGPHLECDG